jgi:predicted  nucleic acid-binding Zn-ribbon protein
VLEYERVSHEEEVEELKKMLKMEMEDKADIIRKTEESLKNVELQMNTELAAEKQIFDAKINDLTKSIEKLMLDNKEASSQSKELRARIEGGKNAATKVSNDLGETISQLEKDLEEEFQITTQLKNGAEELIVKHVADKNANLTHEIEDILGDVRMIQCWQLSHFQLITKLISENKEQVRSIRLL